MNIEPKLVLEVKVELPKTLHIKVIHQDEFFRSTGTFKLIYNGSNFRIVSLNNPQISLEHDLWIRGAIMDDDHKITSHEFGTTENLNRFLEELKKALKHINGSESRFKDA